MVHASIGQILRDSGRPSEALEELERSIAAYASGGMAQLESYMMMVTAELLLGLGRWQEGISHLLGAIAILKRTKVDKEIVAAVELLRAAVNSGLSPSAQATLELRQILGRLER
jgi:hypothetical protein